jgi:hypothetical protein
LFRSGDGLRRIDGHHHGSPFVAFVHDHAAGKQDAHLQVRLQRLVGERRIAGTEDLVTPELDAELLRKRLAKVYLPVRMPNPSAFNASGTLLNASSYEQRRAFRIASELMILLPS